MFGVSSICFMVYLMRFSEIFILRLFQLLVWFGLMIDSFVKSGMWLLDRLDAFFIS